MVIGEHHTGRGEIVIDAETAQLLGSVAMLGDWRIDPETNDQFVLFKGMMAAPATNPWPPLTEHPIQVVLFRPWLLPAVYERELSGQGAFLTELRPAVALFLRFSGIDYDHDPVAGQHLDQLIRSVQHIIDQFAGVLLQLTIGDKGNYIYATFGAPIAHEDDAA